MEGMLYEKLDVAIPEETHSIRESETRQGLT